MRKTKTHVYLIPSREIPTFYPLVFYSLSYMVCHYLTKIDNHFRAYPIPSFKGPHKHSISLMKLYLYKCHSLRRIKTLDILYNICLINIRHVHDVQLLQNLIVLHQVRITIYRTPLA